MNKDKSQLLKLMESYATAAAQLQPGAHASKPLTEASRNFDEALADALRQHAKESQAKSGDYEGAQVESLDLLADYFEQTGKPEISSLIHKIWHF